MRGRYDVIVIGAGHNGLTAAATLAKEGRKVMVLERRPQPGGLAAGEEFHPGYRSAGLLHDTTGVRRWVVEDLGLARHGLWLEPHPPSLFAPQTDGPGLLLHHDPREATSDIGAFSMRDADRYGSYRAFLDTVRPLIDRGMNEAPPDLGQPGRGETWSLLRQAWDFRRLGRRTMMDLLRTGPMPVADWLDEWFETDLLKALLAVPGVESTFAGPRSPGTAGALLLWEVAAQGGVRGGPPALVEALVGACREHGVELCTEVEVTGIRVEAGRVAGVEIGGGEPLDAPVIAASCDPRRTFLELAASRDAPYQLEHRIRHFRGYGKIAKVNLALSGILEFPCRKEHAFSFVRVAEDLTTIEQAFDPVKYGELPERPVLDICVPSVANPDLAPEGHSSISILVHSVPYELEGGWSEEARARLGELVLNRLGEYAPAVLENRVGMEVLSPRDLETRYGLVQGHLHHGDHALDQLVFRPTPETARYRTPIEGLYLCGGGSHPGGGITCAPGALAARAILAGK